MTIGNKEIKKILDTIDGVGTGHGASMDEMKSLTKEIERRIAETDVLVHFMDSQIDTLKQDLAKIEA